MKIFQSSCQAVAMIFPQTTCSYENLPIKLSTCSYENLPIKLSSCSYDFPPIKSINFKSYLTWLGFELKYFGKNKPLICLSQLSYCNRHELWQYFIALCMRERERKRERGKGVSSSSTAHSFWAPSFPFPSLIHKQDRPGQDTLSLSCTHSLCISQTNGTVHYFSLSDMPNHQKKTKKYFPTARFEPTTFRSLNCALTNWAIGTDKKLNKFSKLYALERERGRGRVQKNELAAWEGGRTGERERESGRDDKRGEQIGGVGEAREIEMKFGRCR